MRSRALRNRDALKCVVVCSMAWILTAGDAVASHAGSQPATERGSVERGGASARGVGGEGATRFAESLMENLVEGLDVPPAALSSFEALYQRHKTEIDRFVQDNPHVLWESLDVLLDALPGLKRVGEMGGMLYVPRRTYARASQLVDDVASKLSAPLARDLSRIKNLVQGLFQEGDGGEMMIDLNELARHRFN